MAKTKAVPQTNGSKSKGEKVKDGRVSKSVKEEPVKAKNIAAAPQVNGKAKDAKKSSKKSKPVEPESSASSESESDAASASDSEESSASSESESEAKTVSKPAAAAKAKVNGATPKTNGTKPSTAKAAESGSESDSASEGSDSEGSDSSDDEAVAPAAKATEANTAAAAADESGSDSGSDESDTEAAAKSGVTPKGAAADVKKTEASSDEDSDDGSDAGTSEGTSDSSSDDEEDVKKPVPTPAPAQKRKADAVDETPAAKKAKINDIVSQGSNLFVGSLSWNIDDDWLKREFEHFGAVKGARVITDRESGRSKGFGYVDFENAEDALKAHDEMKGYELDGRAINVDFSQPKQDRDAGTQKQRANDRGNKFGDQQSPPSDTLFVANLSFDTTAESLRELLEQYGSITRVSLPTHQDSGQPKGFGYVGFSSIEEAQAALEAQKGNTIDGRPVRFDFASARPDNGGDRGGRGGGGFGGGRGGGFRGGRGGGDRGGRGGGFRGGRGGDRGGRGSFRGRGGSTNRGGVGDFSGKKVSF